MFNIKNKCKIGQVTQLENCCREVRLAAVPCKNGDIRSGWNTITDEYEEFVVVEVNEHDNWLSLVKRIK